MNEHDDSNVGENGEDSAEKVSQNVAPLNVVIACGGTGGHLFPGVAVAQELRSRGHKVRLLISEKKVDTQASEKYGDLEFDTVPAVAKPATLSPKMIPFLWKLWKTTSQCKSLLKQFGADVVVGMGGFTSLPPVLAGKKLGLKTFVHDSNALPGKANRLTAKFCHKVMIGIEEARRYFPNSQVEHTGTPVREEIESLPSREDAAKAYGLDPAKKTVLVMGGSQGAKKLNSLVVEASKAMPETQFLHITGNFDYERVVAELGDRQPTHKVVAFCDDMPAAYAASDLSVCRSGASSMTELAYVNMPSILVPYPFAADDHQTKNAEVFEKHGAALLRQEADLDGGSLLADLSSLLENPKSLEKMALNAGNLAIRNAAETISQVIETT